MLPKHIESFSPPFQAYFPAQAEVAATWYYLKQSHEYFLFLYLISGVFQPFGNGLQLSPGNLLDSGIQLLHLMLNLINLRLQEKRVTDFTANEYVKLQLNSVLFQLFWLSRDVSDCIWQTKSPVFVYVCEQLWMQDKQYKHRSGAKLTKRINFSINSLLKQQ